jgi:hypothetical protein
MQITATTTVHIALKKYHWKQTNDKKPGTVQEP